MEVWSHTFEFLKSLGLPELSLTLTAQNSTLNLRSKVIYALAAYSAVSLGKKALELVIQGIQCSVPSKYAKLSRGDSEEDFVPKWALILGADTAIGQGFAAELAERGFQLVFVGKDMNSMENYAKSLCASKLVNVNFLELSYSEDHNLNKLLEELDITINGVDIHLVVNAYSHMPLLEPKEDSDYKVFSETCDKQIIVPSVVISKAIQKMQILNHGGLVYNISSGFVEKPSKKYYLFGACANFLDYYSQASFKNHAKKGVFVHTVRHFLSKQASPEEHQRLAKNCLKWAGQKPVIYGGFKDSLKSKLYYYFL